MIVSLITAWALYIAPWRVPADPCFLAAISTMAVVICLWLTRRRGARAIEFERFLVALFLLCMPLVYVLRYSFGSGPRAPHFWLWVEVSGLLFFGALAALGWKRSPWFLAVGIVLHGLTWDSWHYRTSAYMPDWYAIFCAAVDLALGVYVAVRVPVYRAARSRR